MPVNNGWTWITWWYIGIGFITSLALVFRQEHVLDFWVYSEAATVAGVMGAVLGLAARDAYKKGWQDARNDAPERETT
jgi:hypothetical protein